MIFFKHKCIFIHTAKTGGSSIEHIFDSNGSTYIPEQKHWSHKEFKEKYPNEWRDYYRFTVIRNPWSRIFSLWWNLTKNHQGILLRNYLSEQKRKSKRYTYDYTYIESPCQLNCIGDPKDIDYFIRFEDFENSFKVIKEKFELTGEIPKIRMINNKPKYIDYYCEESIDLVRDMCKEEIDYFGYSFS